MDIVMLSGDVLGVLRVRTLAYERLLLVYGTITFYLAHAQEIDT